jgi:hypothetical protein
VDDHSASATLTDGTLSVTMLVKFDNAGLIESGRFEARGAMVDSRIVRIPWDGRWSNYHETIKKRDNKCDKKNHQHAYQGARAAHTAGFAPIPIEPTGRCDAEP